MGKIAIRTKLRVTEALIYINKNESPTSMCAHNFHTIEPNWINHFFLCFLVSEQIRINKIQICEKSKNYGCEKSPRNNMF